MPNITTCTTCGDLYEAGSEEIANEKERSCPACDKKCETCGGTGRVACPYRPDNYADDKRPVECGIRFCPSGYDEDCTVPCSCAGGGEGECDCQRPDGDGVLGVSSYCPVHNENPLPKPDSGDGGGGKHPPAVRDIIEAPFRVHIADLQQRIDKLQAALAERDEARAEADRLSTELGATEDAAHVLEWQLERSQSRVDELTAKLARVRDHLKPLDRWDDLAGELLAILDSEVEPLRVTVDDYDDDWMRVEGNIPSLSTEPQSGDAFLLVPAKEKR